MFPSLVQPTSLLLLALTTLSSARESPLPSSPTASSTFAQDGQVIGHLFPACNGQSLRGPRIHHVPADKSCLTTPGLALQIKSPAICANGTRALWARFTDTKCGRGSEEAEYEIVDIDDGDIGACLSNEMPGGEKMGSMGFWCDGISQSEPSKDREETDDDDEEIDRSKKGSTSESACVPGRAPFFDHPPTDTCVGLKTERLKIYTPAVCKNGTQAALALYTSRGCSSDPSFVDLEDEEENLNTCLDVEGMGSFAFYCTGEGIERDTPLKPENGKQTGGSILHFFLILLLIIMFFFLMLVLSVWAWVRKYGGSVGRLVELVKGFLKRDGGEIAL